MHEIALTIHFIGLAMGLGTSFSFMFLGIASAKMEPREAVNFRLKTMALSRMGHIGLTLLVLSGLYLMTPHWGLLTDMPLLIIKFVLVLVLGALIGMISAQAKKAAQGDAELHLKKMEPLGKIALITTLAIVTLAVFNFR